MVILVVIAPLFWASHQIWHFPKAIVEQMVHADWEGLHVWDLVMPWFIFICGVAIPFTLPKYLNNGRPGWVFLWHITKRVVMLWFLGMLVQGNLLSCNLNAIKPFNNTLQAIASGYLVSAFVWLIPYKNIKIAIPILLATGYGTLLALYGDYTMSGNFALHVDQIVLPMNHDGYGWSLTTMMFAAMTLCGMHCGQLLKSEITPWVKCVLLLMIGHLLLGSGLVLAYWEPVIKRIYTVSFTAQAMGWAVLALAMLYLFADILKLCRGFGLITLYGQTALLAYLCGELFRPIFRTSTELFTWGLPNLFGTTYQPLIQAVVSVFSLTVVLLIRRKYYGMTAQL